MPTDLPIDIGDQYVPDFIRSELGRLPTCSGTGIHRSLFWLAQKLTPWRDPNTVSRIVHDHAACCDRFVPESEIAAALRNGARFAWPGGGSRCDFDAKADYHTASNASSPRPPEPKFDLEVLARFIAGHEPVDAAWLADRSPIRPGNRTPASFLHALYRKGEQVVVFDDYHSQGQFLWTHPGLPYDARTLNHFAKGKPVGVWFLVNPVDGEFHLNDEEKLSRRSHQNVTSWRYLLIESDRSDLTTGDWLAAVVQLPLPIVAIYETGGRLPHVLLRLDAPSKDAWNHLRDSLAPLLIMLGADISSLSAVRLSRLPCCQRLGKEDERGVYQKFADGPHLQQLLYLNPDANGTPIAQQQVWPD